MENNQRFAELAGMCWHKQKSRNLLECSKCGSEMLFTFNPDFTDAREVLRVMMKREDWSKFLSHVYCDIYKTSECSVESIILLVLDPTGKLRDLAIKWMEEQK